MGRGLLVALAIALLAGCGPRPLTRLPLGPELPLEPLARRLEHYNGGPVAARVQGRLSVSGQGSADFGARVAAGSGLRLDAVAGPFGTPIFALACGDPSGCLLYLPRRRLALRSADAGLRWWLEAVLRGRLPLVGEPRRAWSLPDGGAVLVAVGKDGWIQEVALDPTTGVPTRSVLARAGVVQAELRYTGFREVAGLPFPGRVEVQTVDPPRLLALEFQRIEAESEILEAVFQFTPPPGTQMLPAEESDTWNPTQIPLWLPAPGR